MGSFAAKEVAKEVLNSIRRGKNPNVTAIAVEKGYSETTARSGEVQRTQSYQGVIQPILSRWIKERERMTKALEEKDLEPVEYQDLMRSMDLMTKQIQLISGGATENIAIGVKKLSDSDLEKLADGE